MRYQQDFEEGKVGLTVHSRSGWNLAPHRPKKVFDRHQVVELRRQGFSIRQIGKALGIGLGTVSRALEACSKGTRAEKDVLPQITPSLSNNKLDR